MDELKQRLLEKIKKLKGIDDTNSDDVFLFAIETAVYDVLNYCHFKVDDWPEALDSTTILMTVDLINETSYSLSAAEAENEVKSLSEGDFSITKETKAEAFQKMMSVPSFSRNYCRNLNNFRKLG
ncbi:phage head-tail connector protein [Enterococcus sp. DIV1420a]|uniref:phage head-tail connector protein n=1 Tax=Enterococcus sp. DIV1420a TaxID=2774672 RepID=UPI003F28C58D